MQLLFLSIFGRRTSGRNLPAVVEVARLDEGGEFKETFLNFVGGTTSGRSSLPLIVRNLIG